MEIEDNDDDGEAREEQRQRQNIIYLRVSAHGKSRIAGQFFINVIDLIRDVRERFIE